MLSSAKHLAEPWLVGLGQDPSTSTSSALDDKMRNGASEALSNIEELEPYIQYDPFFD